MYIQYLHWIDRGARTTPTSLLLYLKIGELLSFVEDDESKIDCYR